MIKKPIIFFLVLATLFSSNKLNTFSLEDKVKNSIIENPMDYGAKGNGINDDTNAFVKAISIIESQGGGKFIAPYSSKGYLISRQIYLNNNIEFDLNGSTIIQSNELLDAKKNSVIYVKGSNNLIRNVKFNSLTGQFGIEFDENSKNNLEMNCLQQNSSGLRNLIKIESENVNSKSNKSLTLESFSKAKPYKRLRKWEITKMVDANTSAIVSAYDFPSKCRIKKIIVSDTENPDFYFSIYTDNFWKNKVFEVKRTNKNVDNVMDLQYFKENLDDVLKLYMWNYKNQPTFLKIEIWIEEDEFYNPKKTWQFYSKDDLLRPHKDNQGNLLNISMDTVNSIEYRYRTKDNPLAVNLLSVSPNRDSSSNYHAIKIPTPLGKQQDKSWTQLKFYFDYSAMNAVSKNPSEFIFKWEKLPKSFNGNLIVGWISQNKDGDEGYLKQAMIYTNEKPLNVRMEGESGSIKVNIDPKGYQLGSSLNSDISFDFFYVIFETNDPNFSFNFGEEYGFNAYFK